MKKQWSFAYNGTNTKGESRTHRLFGRCNAGKSTLINMLTDQPVSLVSEVAGTTTDPVSKSMEILPLGPVVITDTAGIDDTSELGALRIEKSEEIIKKSISLSMCCVMMKRPLLMI